MGSVEVVAQPARIKVKHRKIQILVRFIFVLLSKALSYRIIFDIP